MLGKARGESEKIMRQQSLGFSVVGSENPLREERQNYLD